MSIDSLQLFARNEAKQQAVILGMGSSRQRHCFRARVCDEEFLSSDADALAAVLDIDLGYVGLKPIGVLAEALPLRTNPGDFLWVGYLDHLDWRGLHTNHENAPGLPMIDMATGCETNLAGFAKGVKTTPTPFAKPQGVPSNRAADKRRATRN